MSFLRSKYAGVLTVLLILQGIVFYAVALRAENTPPTAPLSYFPTARRLADVQGRQIEQETLDVLKADDTLNRVYINPGRNASTFLFIAFFKTQRYGQAPHSPKNCLPGNGFEPIESGQISVDGSGPVRAGPSQPVSDGAGRRKKRHVVLVSESRSDYRRGVCRPVLADRRLDTVPPERHLAGEDRGAGAGWRCGTATRTAVDFMKAIFPPLVRQLPT